MPKVRKLALLATLTALLAAPALGQDQPSDADQGGEVERLAAKPPKAPMSIGSTIATIGACIGAGLCVAGGGLAIAKVGAACIQSIARQPEAGGTMFAPMVVAAAMIEGGMLFGILVCLLAVVRS